MISRGYQRLMMLSLLAALATMSLLSVMDIRTEAMEACSFNALCTCRSVHHEVTCRGVIFSTFPSLSSVENAYQVTFIRSGLQTLENGSFLGTSVASLHLMHNDLKTIESGAFDGLEDLITTVDLSHNSLQEFPIEALRNLRQLRWLNLNSNDMKDIRSSKWSHLSARNLLQSLFLGGNHISVIKDDTFLKFVHLNVLDLGDNIIHAIGNMPFPPSLTTLTLSNNLLREVPGHALYPLKRLRWLYLSGNLLKHLPSPLLFQTPWLDILDLSNNVLKSLPRGFLNNTVILNELNLGFNFLRTLPAQAFLGSELKRLFLSNNRISSMHSDAMWSIENSLTVLDLSYNLLEQMPIALSTLKSLLHLSLRGNLIKELAQNDLYGCRGTLEIIDLSGNKLSQVPKNTLRSFSHLVRLGLQDNRIQKVYRDDFEGWGSTLNTLSLANNRMTYLSGGTFMYTPKLRELKLSFNNLMYLDQYVFAPIKNSLEVLELSAAFSEFTHPLEYFIRDLQRVEWLQLDHNNISKFSEVSFHSLNRLIHVDMEGNDLESIPEGLFDSSYHRHLSTVHISNNQITSIKTGTFSGLRHLSNVVLYNNDINVVETEAFSDCPFLHTIVMSSNSITSIEPAAFHNLTRLRNVFFENNRLETFSLDVFFGQTGELYLNLSGNSLTSLETQSSENYTSDEPVAIRTLDLTNNRLTSIPIAFMTAVSENLLYLFFSFNFLRNISLPSLPILQKLEMSHNKISKIDETTFDCCASVQSLALAHNELEYLEEKVWSRMENLRILDLSYNNIKVIAENVFSGTRLERLNLSHNAIAHDTVSAKTWLNTNLRYLDLSGNHIGRLTRDFFKSLTKLQALNMSSNELSFLEEQCFADLTSLMDLDLSNNPLQHHISEEVLWPLLSLRSLHMSNVSLVHIPHLPLPELRELDVSKNLIFNISQSAFHRIRKLRSLRLSRNLLLDVPSHLWHLVPSLLSLDISRNLISVLGANTFVGLYHLRSLNVQGLPLRRLDLRALHSVRFLTSFATDSYPPLRSFRLQDLLSLSPAVRQVTINIEETTLSHQLQGAFGTKLRELVITGSNLRRILPDAFAGMLTHELTLRIAGTSATRFPDGLLKYLPDVRHLTLDLRSNKLSTLRPQVLASVTNDGIDVEQTQHITGGILLEDNPWTCSCELLWLGRWIKRWLRETFQMHLLSVEAALYVNGLARKATCSFSGSNVSLPLVDLKSTDLGCMNTNASPRMNISPTIVTIGLFVNLYWFKL